MTIVEDVKRDGEGAVRRWALELAQRLPLAEPPSRRQLDATVRMVSCGVPAAVDLGRRWVVRRRGATL